jgi:1-aminocyclopropane-1-carboxylate deaminase
LELSKLIQEPEIQKICLPELNNSGHELFILRLDAMHPRFGGNKYFKLIKNIEKFSKGNYAGILSFGGAYSNHLTALAWVCQVLNIPCTLFIRGEETLPYNPRIVSMKKSGAAIRYLSRENYRLKEEKEFLTELQNEFTNYLIIPEGANNSEGMEGCKAIANFIPQDFKHIFLPVGTAGTITGLAAGLKAGQKLWGVSVLKGMSGIEEQILLNLSAHTLGSQHCNLALIYDGHFGGYAKRPEDLLQKISFYENQLQGIKLEPVYMAKAFLGMLEQIKQNKIIAGEKILLVHTGGWFDGD